ncbi:unnamed protein product [Heterobilharzia americana]|nr:unnamed protein product [Heterobilharzia americana]
MCCSLPTARIWTSTIVLSRTSEPALVEVFKVADKPGSIPPLSDLTEGSVNLPNVETKHNQSVVSHHIEFILARVNTQKSRSSSKNGEMVTKNTQSSDISDGIMKSSVPEFTLSEPQFEDLPNILESYWNHTGNVALDACQKVADALVNIFHFGFDKFCVVNGDGCFGPKKFNQLPKSSLSSLNPHSSNSDTNADGLINRSLRFVARCRARGDATAADLLTLPSSVISHSQAVIDEMDVRRARSLLDRCRTYLTTSDYKRMMRNLSSLNQAIQNPTSIVGTHDHSDKTEVLVSLSRVLNCLKKHVSLWEDFVCLLTPSQARSLGLLSTYFNLAHIARVQRVLQDIVPRDRRFWRRLRNLADSCNIEVRHIPVKKKIYMDQNDTTLESSNISEQSLNDCNQRISRENHTSRKLSTTEKNSGVILNKNQSKSFRVRGMRLKGGSMHDAFAKTWSVLESSWRNRPVLLSRIASLINTRHKPYAGFEQSFEETDVLARHSVGIPIPSEELSQSISASNADDCIRPLKVKTGSPVSILPPQVLSFLSEGWEVCTELSSTVHSRNNSLGVTWARRQCPCRCHPVSSNKFSITTGQSGKPAKVDSLGLRHCISCSLRVHRGIVYIDACNLHLRHVKITWPPNFKPKARLPSNPSLIDSALNQNHRPTTIHHTPSNIPTRIAVNELVKMHARSYSSNKLSNHCTLLPDMAGRRVSIEYIPALKSTTSSNRKVTDFSNQDEGNASKAVDGIQLPCPPIVPNRNRSSSEPLDLGSISSNVENPAIWTLDDEAACFNTEAFASTSNTNHENEFINNETDDWTSEEDRQLLEFCKARGLYSSRMFKDLARIWEPKPYNYSPQRNSAELEARFKYLMRITLREAYDPELFQTPYREDSPYEDS